MQNTHASSFLNLIPGERLQYQRSGEIYSSFLHLFPYYLIFSSPSYLHTPPPFSPVHPLPPPIPLLFLHTLKTEVCCVHCRGVHRTKFVAMHTPTVCTTRFIFFSAYHILLHPLPLHFPLSLSLRSSSSPYPPPPPSTPYPTGQNCANGFPCSLIPLSVSQVVS